MATARRARTRWLLDPGECWTKAGTVIGARKLSTPMENLRFEQVSFHHLNFVSRMFRIDYEYHCLEGVVRDVTCARRQSPSSPKSFEPDSRREDHAGKTLLWRPPHLNSQLMACGV
jgi:hypothetical protein